MIAAPGLGSDRRIQETALVCDQTPCALALKAARGLILVASSRSRCKFAASQSRVSSAGRPPRNRRARLECGLLARSTDHLECRRLGRTGVHSGAKSEEGARAVTSSSVPLSTYAKC